MDSGRPPAGRVEIVVSGRTLLQLLAFGLLVVLAALSIDTLLSILIAAVLALGLDPIVAGLVRRGWSRGLAAFTVFAGVIVAVVVIVILAVGPVFQEVEEFFRALPGYWDELTQKPGFQDIVDSAGADDKIRHALGELAAGLPDAASAVAGLAAGAFGTVLSAVTLAFLALFLLMERPLITDWLFGFTPPQAEARWRPVLEHSIRAVSSSLVGNIAISIIAGTIAGVSAWLLGLPFPVVLGVITGLLDLIPQVGATVAAVILTCVALTVGTTEAVITVIIQLVYQQLENYVIAPIVYREAVDLTPLTTIVSVLVAGALLGVVGAILAVPFAAVIKLVIGEAGKPRRERLAALRATAREGAGSTRRSRPTRRSTVRWRASSARGPRCARAPGPARWPSSSRRGCGSRRASARAVSSLSSGRSPRARSASSRTGATPCRASTGRSSKGSSAAR
jgi:predicted PurR-regulated permease PerM